MCQGVGLCRHGLSWVFDSTNYDHDALWVVFVTLCSGFMLVYWGFFPADRCSPVLRGWGVVKRPLTSDRASQWGGCQQGGGVKWGRHA